MTPLDLSLAVLALLLTPGPTNTLILLAGAERGLQGALRLIPAELAGYFLTVLPLALLGAAALEELPALRVAVTLAAALWVAVLAVRLWRLPGADPAARSVSAGALVTTTALNPKALIFGLVLLPSPDRLGWNLALFAALVALVGVFWAAVGAGLRGRGKQRGGRDQGGQDQKGQPRAMLVLRRLASVFLAVMSVLLALRGVGA